MNTPPCRQQTLNVLITRPEHKSQALVELLAQQNIHAIGQPLFDYQAYTDQQTIKAAVEHADILIFVSVPAVAFANKQYSLAQQNDKTILAVGNATKNALHNLGLSHASSPTLENSEGLLALETLADVKGKNIVIFRGDGGRELIADTLKARGANLSYIESYQRVWRTFAKNIAQQWQQQQINCIVVTSNAILNKLVALINVNKTSGESQQNEQYWLTDCIWLVASERIADNAKKLGLTKVINMQGASDTLICQQLRQL